MKKEIDCPHKEIVMVNREGKKCEGGGNEVDFVIRCHDCDEDLFRISEYKRTFTNLSHH